MPDYSPKPTNSARLRRAVLVVFFVMCSVLSIGICFWIFQDDFRLPSQSAKGNRHTPQPERYLLLKKDLEIRKDRLALRFKNASGVAEEDAILFESRKLLESILPEMMRCWLGTPWDFNGTCSTPGSGDIACGYFVTTIMRDAGFSLHRSKLAQQPSQTILRAFVPRDEMEIRSEMEYTKFCDMLIGMPAGIYIVGLDKHVGFVVHDGQQLRFLHSSGSDPWCVVDESTDEASALQKSSYRVVGNITAQSKTLKKWLSKEQLYPKR